MRDAIIMTLYNKPARVLGNTIDGLLQSDVTNAKLFIMDDSSTVDYSSTKKKLDQSALDYEWVTFDTKAERPDAYQVDGWNVPALGMNKGIRLAYEASAENLFVLGSDIVLPEGALQTALRQMNGEGRVVCGQVTDEVSSQDLCSSNRPYPMPWFICANLKRVVNTAGYDEEYLRGVAFDDNDFMGRLFLETGEILISSEIECIHQSHPKVPYTDEFKGWHANEEYTKSKWECNKPPFADNAPPISWAQKDIEGGLLMYGPQLRPESDRESIYAEANKNAINLKDNLHFFKRCSENRELLQDIFVTVPCRPEEPANIKLADKLAIWYGEGSPYATMNHGMAGFIEVTRAKIALDFLHMMNQKFLIMIDSDVEPPMDLPWLLARHDLPIVGAPCMIYSKEYGPQLNFTVQDEEGNWRFPAMQRDKIPWKGLAETAHLGTGAICIRRDVLEAFTYDSEDESPFFVPTDARLRGMRTGQMVVGEDIAFSAQVRKKGFKIHVDLEAHCGHRKTVVMLWDDSRRDKNLNAEHWIMRRGTSKTMSWGTGTKKAG